MKDAAAKTVAKAKELDKEFHVRKEGGRERGREGGKEGQGRVNRLH